MGIPNNSKPENSENEDPINDKDIPNTEETVSPQAQFIHPEKSKDPEKKWYILRVQSGKEDRVKINLEKRITTLNVEDKISRVVVPTERVSEIKKGFKRVVDRKLYPGYVMIEMVLNDDTQYIVKSTPGVGDFVGTATAPVPMSDAEIERMLVNYSQSKDKPKPKVSFRKGQNIKIKEGPFENFDGIVDEVNEQKGIVKVIVAIFGRYTQLELEYWQVESL